MSQNIIIKRNLIVFCTLDDWHAIHSMILRDYGMGMAIRYRLRSELGFTYRYHRGLVPNMNARKDGPSMRYQDQVHLDFYNEPAQSWFQLKYLNINRQPE